MSQSRSTTDIVDPNLEDNTIVIDGKKILLTKKLGEGNRGAVYKGYYFDKDDKRIDVCVKKVKKGKSSRSEKNAASEAKAIHIVYDHETEVVTKDQAHYFTMPLFKGKMLDELITNNELTLYQKIKVVEKLKKQIERMHKKGYLHRDLKPNNIIVEIKKDGKVKVNILDMGRSVRLDAEDKSLIDKNLNYAQLFVRRVQLRFQKQVPHEQLEGSTIGAHSDIYSFGVIFKQLFPEELKLITQLTGRDASKREEAFFKLEAKVRSHFVGLKNEAVQECQKTDHDLCSSKYAKKGIGAMVEVARGHLDSFQQAIGNARIDDIGSLSKVRDRYVDLEDSLKRIKYNTSFLRKIAIFLHLYVPPEKRMRNWLQEHKAKLFSRLDAGQTQTAKSDVESDSTKKPSK